MRLLSRLHRPKSGRTLARSSWFLPRLEILEDRTVPSAPTLGPLVVVSVPDPLAGCPHDEEWQHGDELDALPRHEARGDGTAVAPQGA